MLLFALCLITLKISGRWEYRGLHVTEENMMSSPGEWLSAIWLLTSRMNFSTDTPLQHYFNWSSTTEKQNQGKSMLNHIRRAKEKEHVHLFHNWPAVCNSSVACALTAPNEQKLQIHFTFLFWFIINKQKPDRGRFVKIEIVKQSHMATVILTVF